MRVFATDRVLGPLYRVSIAPLLVSGLLTVALATGSMLRADENCSGEACDPADPLRELVPEILLPNDDKAPDPEPEPEPAATTAAPEPEEPIDWEAPPDDCIMVKGDVPPGMLPAGCETMTVVEPDDVENDAPEEGTPDDLETDTSESGGTTIRNNRWRGNGEDDLLELPNDVASTGSNLLEGLGLFDLGENDQDRGDNVDVGTEAVDAGTDDENIATIEVDDSQWIVEADNIAAEKVQENGGDGSGIGGFLGSLGAGVGDTLSAIGGGVADTVGAVGDGIGEVAGAITVDDIGAMAEVGAAATQIYMLNQADTYTYTSPSSGYTGYDGTNTVPDVSGYNYGSSDISGTGQ